MPHRFFEVVSLHERFYCNRRKRKSRDEKKTCLVVVCEIRDALHEHAC